MLLAVNENVAVFVPSNRVIVPPVTSGSIPDKVIATASWFVPPARSAALSASAPPEFAELSSVNDAPLIDLLLPKASVTDAETEIES